MIKTNIENLRDPFIILENNKYYMYGTGVKTKRNWNDTFWACYINESGRLDGEWKKTESPVYITPENAEKNFWAPEVHKYKGCYYMFATYYSSLTNHRGCTILKSSSPEGPFMEITNGHITPADWDAIDGTFYVDEDGQPWMIFVHEWTSTDDKTGRMAAAKLSDDLTHFISEPIELFRADDPEWTDQKITDGCFMYKSKDEKLLMIWSINWKEGYCEAIARSENGKITGKWVQEKEPFFSKLTTGEYDGGHGMIFKDTDGQIYLAVHSPNTPTEETGQNALFIPLVEENGTLKCK